MIGALLNLVGWLLAVAILGYYLLVLGYGLVKIIGGWLGFTITCWDPPEEKKINGNKSALADVASALRHLCFLFTIP